MADTKIDCGREGCDGGCLAGGETPAPVLMEWWEPVSLQQLLDALWAKIAAGTAPCAWCKRSGTKPATSAGMILRRSDTGELLAECGDAATCRSRTP